MIFLLDTNTVSDLVRERTRVLDQLNDVAGVEQVVICSTVRGEVLFGLKTMAPGRKRKDLEARLAALFRAIPCVPIPAHAADEYASIKAECRRIGYSIDDNDAWIAAMTVVLGATLVTRDADMRRVPGLSVVDWS
jgi:predicted nucleic acid-binding protein